MIIDKINKDKKVKHNKGFTLIEVMVSVSLFAMVMTLSLGAILSIVDGNKKAQAINAVANNLNFAVESMVRDIKTGYAYKCGLNNGDVVSASITSNISSGNNCIKGNVVNSISLVSTITGAKRGVQYYLDQDVITNKGRIFKAIGDPSGLTVNSYPITSPEVDIQKMDLYVDNPNSDDYNGQPNIFLIIKGTATINPTQSSDFTIQTLISQRNLNLPK